MGQTSLTVQDMKSMGSSFASNATTIPQKEHSGLLKAISSISKGSYGRSILESAFDDFKDLTRKINDILGPECARCGHVQFWHKSGRCKYSREDEKKKCKCKEFTNSNLVYFKRKYGRRK
jgi:hypothetical protein